MHTRVSLISATVLLCALLLAACQTLPLNGKLPENLLAEKLTAVDDHSPFAVSPDGNTIALSRSGLKLLQLRSREQVALTEKIPRKLAWSPSGSSLAALFSEDRKSRVITYDQHGTPLAETVINAHLTDLGWLSESELALGGAVIRMYKFGSNCRTVLYLWKPGRDLPVASDLRDTTLKPETASKLQAMANQGPMMDFSTSTPLISYLHPVDPPLITPYYKLIIREMASGNELEVATVGLASAGARLSADGEKILFSDGTGSTVLRNPWSDELLYTVNSPGVMAALSPDAGSWFADGSLFRNGALLARLASGATAQFTPEGNRLAVQTGDELYLLNGLKPADGTRFVPSLHTKLQQLRSLRAADLISPKEYKDALERITQP